jgi:hypothetical protein
MDIIQQEVPLGKGIGEQLGASRVTTSNSNRNIDSAPGLNIAGHASSLDIPVAHINNPIDIDRRKRGFLPSTGFLLSSVPGCTEQTTKQMLLSWPQCKGAILCLVILAAVRNQLRECNLWW